LFSGALFILFTLSEKRIQRLRGQKHEDLDQFNLAQEAELTQDNLGVRPGNILVPISTNYALYALEAAVRRAKHKETEVVVLHVQILQRAGSAESDLEPDQLFSTIEQSLFSKVLSIAETEGKPVRLAVAAANDLWEGILRMAAGLQSSSVVVGSSSKMSVAEQARDIGLAWERMAEPRPRITLEIFNSSGQEQIFYLGPHAPRLTPKEIDLLHKLWVNISDDLSGEEIHHHDIVHFALTEVERQISNGQRDEILLRMRDHLRGIKDHRLPPS
jgi:hypothetical protein